MLLFRLLQLYQLIVSNQNEIIYNQNMGQSKLKSLLSNIICKESRGNRNTFKKTYQP